MSAEIDTYSLSDLGAVLVKARLSTSEILSENRNIWRYLSSRSVEVMRGTEGRSDKHRIFAAPDFVRSHIYSAIFAASCYHQYYNIFINLSGRNHFSEIATAAIDAAHLSADVVPLELFNFREAMTSPEILKLVPGVKSAIKECFDRHFPKLTYARDAVAHAHDRNFARYRHNSLNAEIGSRPLSLMGKHFLSSNGEEFLFDFQLNTFKKLMSDVEDVLVPS